MQWSDDGIVLAVRPYGESGTIAALLTRQHGRHNGLIRGGRGRAGSVQPGTEVAATWRGRLAEHLGNYTLEVRTAWGAGLLDDPLRLAALSSACALVEAAHQPIGGGQAVGDKGLFRLGARTAGHAGVVALIHQQAGQGV